MLPRAFLKSAVVSQTGREEVRRRKGAWRGGSLVEIDVVGQRHFSCVDLEDAALGREVWHAELDLAIDTARAQQGRV